VLALFLHCSQTPRSAYLQEESLAPSADPHPDSEDQAEVCHGCRTDESQWVAITAPPAIRPVHAQVRDPASKRNAWRQTNLRNRQNCGASVRASEFKQKREFEVRPMIRGFAALKSLPNDGQFNADSTERHASCYANRWSNAHPITVRGEAWVEANRRVRPSDPYEGLPRWHLRCNPHPRHEQERDNPTQRMSQGKEY
jgi:hypothetical protein